MASVVPVYFVWITPELFNFTLGVARRTSAGCIRRWRRPSSRAPGTRWLFTAGAATSSAAVLLGHRDVLEGDERAAVPADRACGCCGGGAGGSARSTASGRRSALVAGRPVRCEHGHLGRVELPGRRSRARFVCEFPFQTRQSGFEVGATKARDEALTGIIFDRRVVLDEPRAQPRVLFRRPLCRHRRRISFPAVFAIAGLLSAPRQRPVWQWLVLAAGLLQSLFFIIDHAVHLWAAAARSATAISWAATAHSVPAAADLSGRRRRSCPGSSAGCSSRRWS